MQIVIMASVGVLSVVAPFLRAHLVPMLPSLFSWLAMGQNKLERFSLSRFFQASQMGLYHSLDAVTNLKYKFLYFLTPNKTNFKEKGTSF